MNWNKIFLGNEYANLWDFITFIAILSIGYIQYRINKRLTDIHDSVSITANDMRDDGTVTFINSGNLNLYICKIEWVGEGSIIELKKPILISASSKDSTYQWIKSDINPASNQEFEIKLYLKDELGRKWISIHGGILKSKKHNNTNQVQSYKIDRKNW